jgi:hypothetical protein
MKEPIKADHPESVPGISFGISFSIKITLIENVSCYMLKTCYMKRTEDLPLK